MSEALNSHVLEAIFGSLLRLKLCLVLSCAVMRN